MVELEVVEILAAAEEPLQQEILELEVEQEELD